MRRNNRERCWPSDVLSSGFKSAAHRLAQLGLDHPREAEVAFLRGRLATLRDLCRPGAHVEVRRAAGEALSKLSASIYTMEERLNDIPF